MTENFDLVVIGTGSAGSVPAYKCRKAGWTVAVVDSLPFGGTCALRGCDPKKVLVGAAEALDWGMRLRQLGALRGEPSIDWAGLMRFKAGFTDPVPDSRERNFHRHGIETVHGEAHFVGRNSLRVGDRTLDFRFAVIASGAEPVPLGIPGEKLLTYSDGFLNLRELPRRIVFVGGGYISFEFAHIAARAGAEATILHRGPRPLKDFDPDLVDHLVLATREIGVRLHLDTPVHALESRDDSIVVRAGSESDPKSFEADLVVHGAGRSPAVGNLDPDAAGIEVGNHGISVNQYLQSVSNESIYAAGDAAATANPPLTPTAAAEGHVVASNILKPGSRTSEIGPVPSIVFTIPPMAAVGMTEIQAKEQGLEFEIKTGETSGWYSSKRVAESHSGYKVVTDKGSGLILGAHLLGAESAEVINLFALAIRAGMTASDLKRIPWGYPSRSSDVSYML